MTTTKINTKDLLLSLNDKPIVIYPAYVRITGDYATAAALAQVLYWHKTMHGRKFYKTDADFSNELILTSKQFERVKSNLKSLDFLTITREQIPAKTFYDVDYDKLAIALCSQNSSSPPPLPLAESSYPQKGETVASQTVAASYHQKGETNTENTQRVNQNNNSLTVAVTPELSPVVVVELEKTFSSEELLAAKKITASLPAQIQLEVLAVLVAALKGKTIKSKIGYLGGIVSRVQDGTFTPLPAKVKPVSSAERIEKEKIKQAESENRGKVDNVRYFADLYKKCGAVAAIPAQYLQAVREQLAGQGIVLNGC